jgi:hypothetical protein
MRPSQLGHQGHLLYHNGPGKAGLITLACYILKRVPILSRYSSFCSSNEFDRSSVSNDGVRDVNMRVIRGLFYKTIISVSKIWYLTHDSQAIICCCESEINLNISQCQHSLAIIPHICRGPSKDVAQILITLWWIKFLDCRTRVVLKKSGEVLDLVPPPSKVHNLIFGRTWIDSPGDMVLTNLTTGDKVVLYFQPCGWFG